MGLSMTKVPIVGEGLLGGVVALFVIIMDLPRLWVSTSSTATNLFLTAIVLFGLSMLTHAAFRKGIFNISRTSGIFLALALGATSGVIIVVIVSLLSLSALGGNSPYWLAALPTVLGLFIAYNTLFFGLFRQIEKKKLRTGPVSFDLTIPYNFRRVLILVNAYVSPPAILLAVSSNYSLAAELALFQLVVTALAISFHHFSVGTN
jgi:hypothetical protein